MFFWTVREGERFAGCEIERDSVMLTEREVSKAPSHFSDGRERDEKERGNSSQNNIEQ